VVLHRLIEFTFGWLSIEPSSLAPTLFLLATRLIIQPVPSYLLKKIERIVIEHANESLNTTTNLLSGLHSVKVHGIDGKYISMTQVSITAVIGHGIGGKYIPINMARLAESQSLE